RGGDRGPAGAPGGTVLEEAGRGGVDDPEGGAVGGGGAGRDGAPGASRRDRARAERGADRARGRSPEGRQGGARLGLRRRLRSGVLAERHLLAGVAAPLGQVARFSRGRPGGVLRAFGRTREDQPGPGGAVGRAAGGDRGLTPKRLGLTLRRAT